MQRTPGMEQTQSLAGARVVRRARRSAEWPTGVLMVAPVALLIAVFFIYSTYRAVYQSTRIESPIFKPRYVGLQNYRDIIDGIVIDEEDAALAQEIEALGVAVRVAQTIMRDDNDRRELAGVTLAFAEQLRS